jgi:diaminopimelate decarboxylase
VFLSDDFTVGKNGHLFISGCDTEELASRFGTPLYVMDEDMVRRSCALYRDSLDRYYGGNGMALYASKALCCKEMCRIAASEGLGLDVVSGGEIYTAVSAGVDPAKLHFHGNCKTPAEIDYALEAGVGRFIVDNIEELSLIDSAARKKNVQAKCLLRIKPGIDAHTHDFIRTGQIDSKFGFALETGEAENAVKCAMTYKNIELVGAGCHIGSQIFETAPFIAAAQVMIDFIADMRFKYGAKLCELDLGGGFGIKYVSSDDPLPYYEYMRVVSEAVKEKCSDRGIELPYILLEPGRSIVGEAGVTLYTVGSVKTIPGVRTYIAVDGGMTDNPRCALYGARYEAVAAQRAGGERTLHARIAGRCCESGDIVTEEADIQPVAAGDIIAVFSTGAYNYSMASNYNRVPRPAMVTVHDGKAKLIIKRETYEDIVRNDI